MNKLSAVVLSALLTATPALSWSFGLSSPRVQSALYESLSVTIPVQVTQDEIPFLTIQWASPEQYSQANLTYPSYSSDLKLTFQKNSKPPQILIQSSKPFFDPIARLLLDIQTRPGQHLYLPVTVLLDSSLPVSLQTASMELSPPSQLLNRSSSNSTPQPTLPPNKTGLTKHLSSEESLTKPTTTSDRSTSSLKAASSNSMNASASVSVNSSSANTARSASSVASSSASANTARSASSVASSSASANTVNPVSSVASSSASANTVNPASSVASSSASANTVNPVSSVASSSASANTVNPASSVASSSASPNTVSSASSTAIQPDEEKDSSWLFSPFFTPGIIISGLFALCLILLLYRRFHKNNDPSSSTTSIESPDSHLTLPTTPESSTEAPEPSFLQESSLHSPATMAPEEASFSFLEQESLADIINQTPYFSSTPTATDLNSVSLDHTVPLEPSLLLMDSAPLNFQVPSSDDSPPTDIAFSSLEPLELSQPVPLTLSPSFTDSSVSPSNQAVDSPLLPDDLNLDLDFHLDALHEHNQSLLSTDEDLSLNFPLLFPSTEPSTDSNTIDSSLQSFQVSPDVLMSYRITLELAHTYALNGSISLAQTTLDDLLSDPSAVSAYPDAQRLLGLIQPSFSS